MVEDQGSCNCNSFEAASGQMSSRLFVASVESLGTHLLPFQMQLDRHKALCAAEDEFIEASLRA